MADIELAQKIEQVESVEDKRPKARSAKSRLGILVIQLVILVVAILAWQFIPQIPGLQDVSPAFDPFFVSSPGLVGQRIGLLVTASPALSIWPPLGQTLLSALLGCLIGLALGAIGGLILSTSRTLTRVLGPFITAANAMPRIALIPIIAIIFGPTIASEVISCVLVVFFVAFFNAYEGATHISDDTLRNARILGANRYELMTRVRLPYVLGWVAATIPNAISFSLIAVVTTELLVGSGGVGRLLLTAVTSVDSTLTFSVVVMLSIVGIALVAGADAARAKFLHWWSAS